MEEIFKEIKIDFENRCDEIASETIKSIEARKMTQEMFKQLMSQQLKLVWIYFFPKLQEAYLKGVLK